MDKERLKGKNVLITGAAQGMGAAVGEHFAAQGAKICLTDVNFDGCKEVEERIRSAGGEAISCKVDVRNREDHVAAVKATVENFHRKFSSKKFSPENRQTACFCGAMDFWT